jgi:molecular chaperone GrpE
MKVTERLTQKLFQAENGAATTGEGSPHSFRVVDRRHYLDIAGSAATDKGQVLEKPRYPSFVEELMARVAETERRFEERKKQIDDEIRRSRERLEADFQRNLQHEKLKIFLPFLEILDNLQRALQAAAEDDTEAPILQGIRMIAGQFESCLKAQGVEPLELLHQPFDPNLSQAVGVVPVRDPAMDGLVVEELLRGYRLGDQVMRPAQVRVGQLAQL